jgi:phosphonate transport system permease protein
MAVAFWGGALLAFPAANLSRLGRPGAGTRVTRRLRLTLVVCARTLLIVLRAIPPPVWALLFLFVLFPGILPGAMALGVYTMGVIGRLMAEAAENLDGRPLRALRAHGASEVQVFCYGIIPSAAPRFVAYGLYRWEVTIRETIVVGVVGAGGLGLVLHQQLAVLDYSGTVATLLAMIALTLIVDLASAAIRRSLR